MKLERVIHCDQLCDILHKNISKFLSANKNDKTGLSILAQNPQYEIIKPEIKLCLLIQIFFP